MTPTEQTLLFFIVLQWLSIFYLFYCVTVEKGASNGYAGYVNNELSYIKINAAKNEMLTIWLQLCVTALNMGDAFLLDKITNIANENLNKMVACVHNSKLSAKQILKEHEKLHRAAVDAMYLIAKERVELHSKLKKAVIVTDSMTVSGSSLNVGEYQPNKKKTDLN